MSRKSMVNQKGFNDFNKGAARYNNKYTSSPVFKPQFNGNDNDDNKNNGKPDKKYLDSIGGLWNGGIIPYTIDINDAELESMVQSAIETYNKTITNIAWVNTKPRKLNLMDPNYRMELNTYRSQIDPLNIKWKTPTLNTSIASSLGTSIWDTSIDPLNILNWNTSSLATSSIFNTSSLATSSLATSSIDPDILTKISARWKFVSSIRFARDDTDSPCSYVGCLRQKNQKISLCKYWPGLKTKIKIGNILHEMTHALGFGHTHQRYDRKNYLKVNKPAIEDASYLTNYKNTSKYTIGPYDFNSIMHYSTGKFYKLQCSDPKNDIFTGNRKKFSANDIKIINSLYHYETKNRVEWWEAYYYQYIST